MKLLKPYYNTIFDLVKSTDQSLCQYLNPESIHDEDVYEEVWDNDVISHINVIIDFPVFFFSEIKRSDRLEQIQNILKTCFEDAIRGNYSIKITNVTLRPYSDAVVFENIKDESMWKPGYFRLFISHVSKYKKSATYLKICLKEYGIDCFVAHEDIKPSEEWQDQIEGALFSMDALCAIIVPEFKKSDWCDQEVGIAFGQHKVCVALNKAGLPYGFLGKFQAIKADQKGLQTQEVARWVWDALCNNEVTRTKYNKIITDLLLNSKSVIEAETWLGIIKQMNGWDQSSLANLYNNYRDNEFLMNDNVLASANEFFIQYQFKEIPAKVPQALLPNDDDLPF